MWPAASNSNYSDFFTMKDDKLELWVKINPSSPILACLWFLITEREPKMLWWRVVSLCFRRETIIKMRIWEIHNSEKYTTDDLRYEDSYQTVHRKDNAVETFFWVPSLMGGCGPQEEHWANAEHVLRCECCLFPRSLRLWYKLNILSILSVTAEWTTDMVWTVCLTNNDNSVNRNYIHSGDRIMQITGTTNKAAVQILSSVYYEALSFW